MFNEPIYINYYRDLIFSAIFANEHFELLNKFLVAPTIQLHTYNLRTYNIDQSIDLL